MHFFGRGQPKGNHANNRAVRAALAENVRTEAPDARNRKAEIVIVIHASLERFHIAAGELVDERDELLGVGRGERIGVGAHMYAVRLI